MKGVQDLFAQGSASPFDVAATNGYSVLHVSTFLGNLPALCPDERETISTVTRDCLNFFILSEPWIRGLYLRMSLLKNTTDDDLVCYLLGTSRFS